MGTYFFYEKLATYYLSNFVCSTCSLSCLVQLIIYKCCSFPLYLGVYLCLQIWTNFTGLNPDFFASENDLRRATNIFAISIFPYVWPAVKPSVKRRFAWNYRLWGGEGSVKISRPVKFYWNRTKLTVFLRERVRKFLMCILNK